MPDAEELPLGAELEELPRTMLFVIFEFGDVLWVFEEAVLKGSHEFIDLEKGPEASHAALDQTCCE